MLRKAVKDAVSAEIRAATTRKMGFLSQRVTAVISAGTRSAAIREPESRSPEAAPAVSAEIRAAVTRKTGFPCLGEAPLVSAATGSAVTREPVFPSAEAPHLWQSVKIPWKRTASMGFPLEKEPDIQLRTTVKFLKTADTESIFPDVLMWKP